MCVCVCVYRMRTPYGRRGTTTYIVKPFVLNDYHVLVQDTRGRFGSDGQFFPVAHEIEDGVEVLKWLKRQSFCNGKIGSFGISYLGLTACRFLASIYHTLCNYVLTFTSIVFLSKMLLQIASTWGPLCPSLLAQDCSQYLKHQMMVVWLWI